MNVKQLPDRDNEVAQNAIAFEVDGPIQAEALVDELNATSVSQEGNVVWVVGVDPDKALAGLQQHEPKYADQDNGLANLLTKAGAGEKLTAAEMQEAVRALLLRKV